MSENSDSEQFLLLQGCYFHFHVCTKESGLSSFLHHPSSSPTATALKVKLCNPGGCKVYPGQGRLYASTDVKTSQYLNARCKSAFLSLRNPQQINWTVLHGRMHRKGAAQILSKEKNSPGSQIPKGHHWSISC